MSVREEIRALLGDHAEDATVTNILSVIDRSVSKGTKTFEENFTKEKLPGIVEAELAKHRPDGEKILAMKQKVFEFAVERGLDPAFCTRHLIGEDEQQTDERLADFEDSFKRSVLGEVDKRLKTAPGAPPVKDKAPGISRNDLLRMRPEDIARSFREGKLTSMLGGGK